MSSNSWLRCTRNARLGEAGVRGTERGVAARRGVPALTARPPRGERGLRLTGVLPDMPRGDLWGGRTGWLGAWLGEGGISACGGSKSPWQKTHLGVCSTRGVRARGPGVLVASCSGVAAGATTGGDGVPALSGTAHLAVNGRAHANSLIR